MQRIGSGIETTAVLWPLSTPQVTHPPTVHVDKHLWEVEELWNNLLDITGRLEDILI